MTHPTENPAEPARKRRTGLVAGIAAGVAVVAGGVAVAFLLTGTASGDDQAEATRVAEGFAAVQQKQLRTGQNQFQDAQRYMCESMRESQGRHAEDNPTVTSSADGTVTASDVQVSGDTGTFKTNRSAVPNANGTLISGSIAYQLTKENGAWKVCGIARLSR
ncbi:hypothetical protein SAMN05216553_10187 [Lentzea fradiae]|uniref:Mce-associated membrane protein n=1 Tax=Lentzea fradiae TaxID=200378 RepID=A0A1G7K569_9PSEU|nr:hypothetical protein [Lentzea fradiae]SDF32316.1 hypothetical protein SAMN05216553_10187 [Lentzea fradiae]